MTTWQQSNPGTCARCSAKLASYDPTLPPVCDRCAKNAAGKWECDLCSARFETEAETAAHEVEVHGGVDPSMMERGASSSKNRKLRVAGVADTVHPRDVLGMCDHFLADTSLSEDAKGTAQAVFDYVADSVNSGEEGEDEGWTRLDVVGLPRGWDDGGGKDWEYFELEQGPYEEFAAAWKTWAEANFDEYRTPILD